MDLYYFFNNTVCLVILILTVVITCCACIGILYQLREPNNRGIHYQILTDQANEQIN